jgi:hypothetical protein
MVVRDTPRLTSGKSWYQFISPLARSPVAATSKGFIMDVYAAVHARQIVTYMRMRHLAFPPRITTSLVSESHTLACPATGSAEITGAGKTHKSDLK